MNALIDCAVHLGGTLVALGLLLAVSSVVCCAVAYPLLYAAGRVLDRLKVPETGVVLLGCVLVPISWAVVFVLIS